jgi:hypothetical protein
MNFNKKSDHERQAELSELFFDSGSLRSRRPPRTVVDATPIFKKASDKVRFFAKLRVWAKRLLNHDGSTR